MADSLYELLVPQFNDSSRTPSQHNAATSSYLTRLSTLSTSSLTTTEPESLSHDFNSVHRSLQALSKRSYKSVDVSCDSLLHLRTTLPQVNQNVAELQDALPQLETSASAFIQKYDRTQENSVLDKRKRAMRLGDNIEQISDILELPTLLSSTIAAATSAANASSTGSSVQSANASYANALDLYAYIKRLLRLYPDSQLIKSIVQQADNAMRNMATSLVSSLRSQNLKLAGAMRLVGLLRRVAPELDDDAGLAKTWATSTGEGSVGALFLVCRLINLVGTLEALDPLKDLANQELSNPKESVKSSSGQQTERYLKRYIEVFREQSFAMISMYKSIFPTSLPEPLGDKSLDDFESQSRPVLKSRTTGDDSSPVTEDDIQQIPAVLSTFTLHLVDLLTATLKQYLPNVQDRISRDSLLMQVLYCANSVGRLGGDFGMILALLEEELGSQDREENADEILQNGHEVLPEWVEIMKKHRVQASRLELLAIGTGSTKPQSVATREVASPS